MTTPEMSRTDPHKVSDERTMLEEWLDYHRATLLRKCAGLDDELPLGGAATELDAR